MKKIIVVLFAFLLCSLTFNIDNCQAQWVPSNTGITSGSIPQVSFPNVNTGYAAVQQPPNSFIFKTTNAASSWAQVYTLTGDTISTLYFINALTGFAGGRTGNIYNTINGGQNWAFQSFSNVFVNKGIKKIKFLNATTGFTVGDGEPNGSIMKTINGGTNWSQQPVPGPTSFFNDIFFVDMETGFTCGDHEILKTTNGGNSWTILFAGISGDPEYWSLFFTNANTGYFSHSQGGYKYTTNGGISFSNIILDTTIGVLFTGIYFTDMSNGYMTNFNMTNYNSQVYKTTNAGINWNIQLNLVNNPLFSVNFLNSSTGYLTGGSIQGLIYKTTNGGEPIGIQNISSEIPSRYLLQQNYPNPFNPTTNIQFALPKSTFVKVIIYDVLGKEVETIVSEQLNAGTYEVDWNAVNYPSGVYYYNLSAGDYTETKKMVLVK